MEWDKKNQISTIIENGCQHDWILIKLGSDQPYLAQQIVHIVVAVVIMFKHFIYISYDLSLSWLHYETLFISNYLFLLLWIFSDWFIFDLIWNNYF